MKTEMRQAHQEEEAHGDAHEDEAPMKEVTMMEVTKDLNSLPVCECLGCFIIMLVFIYTWGVSLFLLLQHYPWDVYNTCNIWDVSHKHLGCLRSPFPSRHLILDMLTCKFCLMIYGM